MFRDSVIVRLHFTILVLIICDLTSNSLKLIIILIIFKYVIFVLAASEESKERNYSTSFEEKHVS